MNFFVHQDRARRNTARLVVLMVAAVAGIVAATYVLVAGVFVVGARPSGTHGALPTASWWQPEVLAVVTTGVAAVVGGGSLVKSLQLSSGGGGHLATLLGGRLLPADTTDPQERKILNVVEEMAIASGLPVPPVYLLDREAGINAFAAGLRLDDAVIGVTRGAVEQLTRDELQGVMAHEFSHILNGDMRLNLRLIAIVHGILVLGLLGYSLLRVAGQSLGRDRDAKSAGLPAALAVLGAILMAVGFVGTFIGSLIKAAVSRQREFLADASAVQFTRNPPGLAGALAKIGAAEAGSRVRAPLAAEASHMFFASALGSLFATHPPLGERIRRLDETAATGAGEAAAAGAFAGTAAAVAGLAGLPPSAPVPTGNAVDSVGAPTPIDLALCRGMGVRAERPLLDAVREPYGVRTVVYALLLSGDGDVRTRQLVRAGPSMDAGEVAELQRLRPLVDAVSRQGRLALVDLAVPTLKGLSPAQYARFRDAVRSLVTADGRVDLFEWMLQKLVIRHVDPAFGIGAAAPRVPRRAGPADVAVVLSALAHVGARSRDAAAAAFARGAEAVGVRGVSLLPVERVQFADLDRSLDTLARVRPASRRRVIDGVVVTISQDGTATPDEVELLRGVAAALDCPMPPAIGVTVAPA